MRTLLTMLFLLAASAAGAKEPRFGGSASIGTGIALSEPRSTPFELRLAALYHVSKRFSAGIGTGLSCYEKTLVPLFGDLRFRLTQSRKFTPVVACEAGYAFAPANDANGGLYLNPTVGVEYSLNGRLKLLLAVGYQIQRLERLKGHQNKHFKTGFCEQLRHNSASVRIGIRF